MIPGDTETGGGTTTARHGRDRRSSCPDHRRGDYDNASYDQRAEPCSGSCYDDSQRHRCGTPATSSHTGRVCNHQVGDRRQVWRHAGRVDPRPPNGWAYRATISRALTFTVPAGCVVDDAIGRHKPGEHITATELTIYCPA